MIDNDEIIKAIAENTQRSKSNQHRIDELSQNVIALNKMATALEVLATKQNAMSETVHAINEKVSLIESRPIKRISTIFGYLAAAAASALAGAWFGWMA